MPENTKLRDDIRRDVPDIDHPRANALRNGAGQMIHVPVVLWHKGEKVLEADVQCPPGSAALYLPALSHVLSAMERAGVDTRWDEASFLRDDVRHARAAAEADIQSDRLAGHIARQQRGKVDFAMARGLMHAGLKAAIDAPPDNLDAFRERVDIALAVYEAALHIKYASVTSDDIPKSGRMRWFRKQTPSV